MSVPLGSAVLALVGDVSGDSAHDVRAKALALLDYDHVAQLVVDLRGAGTVEDTLLDDIHRFAHGRGKSIVVRERPLAD